MSALDNMTIVGWERNRSQLDALVENHGSIFLIRPVSESAREWLKNNVAPDAPHFGSALAVEHRCIADIVEGMQDDGLVLQ